MIAIVTSIYDYYDALNPVIPQDIPVEWVCVTDDATLEQPGWNVIHRPRPLTPRLAAKIPKVFPWTVTDAPASIWIDAACQVTSPSFAREALEHAWPIAMFPHPERDCLYTEAHAARSLPRFDGAPIDRQCAHYRRRGHPEHWGLWAATVIVRRHTDDVRRLSDSWAAEMTRWSDTHDQHTFAYAARTEGIRPRDLPGTHTANPWLEHRPSDRHFA